MVNYIDVNELESELSRTRKKFEEWATKLQRNAVDVRDNHIQSMSDQTGKIDSLIARASHMQQQAEQVKERVSREEAESSALQQEVVAYQAEHDKLKLQVEQLKSEKQLREAEFQREEAAHSVEDNGKKKRLGALRKALALYSSRLGLTFKQGNDELQLVFTQIIRSNPTQEFVINVQISAENTYNVTKSEPAIPKLPELVQRLNQDNNFSAFIKKARAEFVAMSASA
eukprot:gene2989-12997_t